VEVPSPAGRATLDIRLSGPEHPDTPAARAIIATAE